jgi:MFS-type transporter involved in bile tolerance (Atg22 family)
VCRVTGLPPPARGAVAAFVKQQPGYRWLGLACLAVGTAGYELASVFYNSLLPLVSTPEPGPADAAA